MAIPSCQSLSFLLELLIFLLLLPVILVLTVPLLLVRGKFSDVFDNIKIVLPLLGVLQRVDDVGLFAVGWCT